MNFFQIINSFKTYYSENKAEFDAIVRSIINVVLVLVDMFPGITIITDISETINFLTRVSTKFGYKLPQLTPDVPTLLLGGTVITNPVLEILTFGVFPTYLIPTLVQLYKDRKKLRKVMKLLLKYKKSTISKFKQSSNNFQDIEIIK